VRDGTFQARYQRLRSVGGLLFAAGAVVLLVRKTGHDEWSPFARFLVALVPAVVLYALALDAQEPPQSDGARPWQSVLMVVAILFVPVALFEFLGWVGASRQHALYDAGVFAATSLLAGYAARRAHASYAALLAGLSSLLVWLFVWEKILDHPSANTDRWLTVAAGALLLVVAGGLARAKAVGASEVATAGGAAAVAAGVLGVIVGAVVGLARSITKVISGASGSFRSSGSGISVVGSSARVQRILSSHLYSSHISPTPFAIHTNGLQHFGWDLYLLVVSLALIWIGSRARVRGLGYVGAFGLLAFLISVGAQITRVESGHATTGAAIGWPLVLLIVGAAGLAAPALYRRQS
jgi:hypothetical protein